MINIDSNNVMKKILRQADESSKELDKAREKQDQKEIKEKLDNFKIYDQARENICSMCGRPLKIKEESLEELKKNIEQIDKKIQKEKLYLNEINVKETLINKYRVIRNKNLRDLRRNNNIGFVALGSLTGSILLASNLTPVSLLIDLTTATILGMTYAALIDARDKSKFDKENTELLEEPLSQKELPNEERILSKKHNRTISNLSDHIVEKTIKEEAYLTKKKEEIDNQDPNQLIQSENLGFVLDNLDRFTDRTIQQKVTAKEIDNILDNLDTLVPHKKEKTYQKVKHI